MIQRTQTIYLFLAFISALLIFFFPLLSFTQPDGHMWTLLDNGILTDTQKDPELRTVSLQILIGLVTLLPLISIFLYRKRHIQMRLTIYCMILLIGLLGMLALYGWKLSISLDATVHIRFITIMPLIAFIFNLLAFRGIRRDDLLIKGLNRIR
ncbi:MAG: DUF4293 domain-containing protein [Bacteroidales bacterium]|nr:DUF4293 domain-containing protein [Bacteroidales bacterium]